MEKQKEFDRTSDACLDCIHMLAVIDGANWMITDVAHKYADYLTEDDKKKLDEVKRDLKECTHKTNSALEGIFSKLSTFIQPVASKPKYESFIIPRELIDYENDKKILLHIPDEMEYGGYSTWFSKKFVTDDPSGEMLQVRMYPDWEISMYRYEKEENGKYHAVEMKKVVAENLFQMFSALEDVNQKDDLAAAL